MTTRETSEHVLQSSFWKQRDLMYYKLSRKTADFSLYSPIRFELLTRKQSELRINGAEMRRGNTNTCLTPILKITAAEQVLIINHLASFFLSFFLHICQSPCV